MWLLRLHDRAMNAPVNLRVQYDSKDNGHEMACVFASKQALVRVDEPVIVPGKSKLKHYRVTVQLDSSKFYPQDMALLVFDRVSPGNQDS